MEHNAAKPFFPNLQIHGQNKAGILMPNLRNAQICFNLKNLVQTLFIADGFADKNSLNAREQGLWLGW